MIDFVAGIQLGPETGREKVVLFLLIKQCFYNIKKMKTSIGVCFNDIRNLWTTCINYLEFYTSVLIVGVAVLTTINMMLEALPSTENVTVARSIQSTSLQYILVAEVAIASQMILDVVVDLISDPKTIKSRKVTRFNLMILMMLLIYSVTLIAFTIPDGDYRTMFFLKQVRQVVVYTCILSYANIYGKAIWNSIYVKMTVIIFGGLGYIFKVMNAIYITEYGDHDSLYGTLLTVCGVCSSMLYVLYFCYWCFFLWRKSKSGIAVTLDEWRCTLYVSLSLGLIFLSWWVAAAFGNPSLHFLSADQLIYEECAFTIFIIIIAMHQSRVVRTEAMKHKTVRSKIKLNVRSVHPDDDSQLRALKFIHIRMALLALAGVYRRRISVDHNPVTNEDHSNISLNNRSNNQFSRWSSVHHTAIRERSIENLSTCYTSEMNNVNINDEHPDL
eukprot:gene2279-4433_t